MAQSITCSLTTEDGKIDLALLHEINTHRIANNPDPKLEGIANTLYRSASFFAVYGTLGPGCPNHQRICDLDGNWTKDIVRGSLVQTGWGAQMGYPALVWSSDGGEIGVQVLKSTGLETKWMWLDEFEGGEYVRILVPLESGRVANIYAAKVE